MLGNGFCVARVLGIRINVDWGLLVLLGLLTVNLGVGLLPAWHPEWSSALALGVGLAAAVSFTLSILVHELSHALVGRIFSIPIHSITLFIFGGAANMEEEPRSARSEFLMAGVGPLTSLVIGALCFAATWQPLSEALASGSSATFSHLGPASTLLLWLGPTNFVLAVFNLIPAFPLDGGRLLRSTVWAATGRLDRATSLAAYTGRAFAWALIALGASMLLGAHIPYLGGSTGQGLWFGLVGWFLDHAAAESLRRERARRLLTSTTVATFVRPGVVTLAPETPLEELAERWLTVTDQPVFPVLFGGLVVGLVTREGLRRVPRARWGATTAREVMLLRSDFEMLAVTEEGTQALAKLQATELPALPVLETGELVGLLYHVDLTRYVRRGPPKEGPQQRVRPERTVTAGEPLAHRDQPPAAGP
jgi:Zn-dependent protease